MWFCKKVKAVDPTRYWEVYPQFRWLNIASGYTGDGSYKYLTEPVLQFKTSKESEWRDVSSTTEVRKVIA